jgi:hypothetical protein
LTLTLKGERRTVNPSSKATCNTADTDANAKLKLPTLTPTPKTRGIRHSRKKMKYRTRIQNAAQEQNITLRRFRANLKIKAQHVGS